MGTKRIKTVPAHEWVLAKEEHKASSELEAMMIHDDSWEPVDYEFLDLLPLSPSELAVAERMFVSGWSTRACADDLGFSIGKVHMLKHSAMTKLREFYSERVRNRGD